MFTTRGTGGGLLTYVKEDIPFRVVDAYREGCAPGAVEAQALEIRTERVRLLRLYNVYVPPDGWTRGEARADPYVLNCSQEGIYVGDFNAHSALWEDTQPEDRRGEELENWMTLRGLTCLNDGSATRVNVGTAGDSSPDLTFVPLSLEGRCDWRVAGFGSSPGAGGDRCRCPLPAPR